jgi:hypothetical protein
LTKKTRLTKTKPKKTCQKTWLGKKQITNSTKNKKKSAYKKTIQKNTKNKARKTNTKPKKTKKIENNLFKKYQR